MKLIIKKERLKYKDELNLNLIQRNRELKAKLRLQLSLKSELTEKELLLTVGLESLLLLKVQQMHFIIFRMIMILFQMNKEANV